MVSHRTMKANRSMLSPEIHLSQFMRRLNLNAPAIGVILVLIGAVFSTGSNLDTNMKSIDRKIDQTNKDLAGKIDLTNNSLRDILLSHEGRIASNTVKAEQCKPSLE